MKVGDRFGLDAVILGRVRRNPRICRNCETWTILELTNTFAACRVTNCIGKSHVEYIPKESIRTWIEMGKRLK
jgi:hypothetical protein